jgi:hypothetical protein
MDELLKALTNLINTGGSLADDALYLFFVLKFLGVFAWSVPVWIIASTVLKVIKILVVHWHDGWHSTEEMLKWAGLEKNK